LPGSGSEREGLNFKFLSLLYFEVKQVNGQKSSHGKCDTKGYFFDEQAWE
jgi:hypothetical protein